MNRTEKILLFVSVPIAVVTPLVIVPGCLALAGFSVGGVVAGSFAAAW